MVWRPGRPLGSWPYSGRVTARPERDTTRANHHHQKSRSASGDLNEMTDLGNCSQRGDPSLERGFILWSDISLSKHTGDDFAASLPRNYLASTSKPRLSEAAMLQHSTLQPYCKEPTAPSLSTREALGIFVTVASRPFRQSAEGPWQGGEERAECPDGSSAQGCSKAPSLSLVPAVRH